MAAIEMKREAKPYINFPVNSLPKSESWYGEVRMPRNIIRATAEEHSATSEETEKTLNASLPWSTGNPCSCTKPPGTVATVANATPMISAATTEHDCAALFNHFAHFFASSWCVSVKTSIAVLPSWFWRFGK